MTILIPGKPEESSIIVQTRLGRDIDNNQLNELSHFELATSNNFEKKYPNAITRTALNTIYNCHGMTFASRRTSIFDSTLINAILEDDGYVEVQINEVLPGDVIIYRSASGDVEHSGVVISIPRDSINNPQIVSKWGKFSEKIHWMNDCPYDSSYVKYFRIKK